MKNNLIRQQENNSPYFNDPNYFNQKINTTHPNNIIPELINSYQLFKLFTYHLEKQHNMSSYEINNFLFGLSLNEMKKNQNKEELLIPITIFNEKLSSLETVVKFLKENHSLKIREIASMLNRNIRTIWTTYNNAKNKMPDNLLTKKLVNDKSVIQKYFIPISKFSDRNYSSLEVIVKYIKENYSLTFHEIAILLKRDDSTIWTIYHRAKLKEKNIEKKKSKNNLQKTANI